MKYRIMSLLLVFAIIFSITTVYVEGETDNRATRTITKDTVYSGTLTEGSTDIYIILLLQEPECLRLKVLAQPIRL